MTNDVRLCISGSRVGYVGEGIEDEDISVIVSGKYELVNGVHKVKLWMMLTRWLIIPYI